MGTQVYRTRDGKRVPSVTTVLGRFKDAGPLMHWAWEQGKEGKDFRETRDAAATAGTLAHSAIEHWKKGEQFVWPADGEIVERAKSAFGAFLEWADQTKLKVDKTELPLISEKYGYGGTFDAILLGTKRAMGDWKTSNGVYGEYLAQLAAYGQLWAENFPEEPITGGYHLLRFDKNFGDFSHKWWGELGAGWSYFLRLREAYEFDKELKARAK
jgi:hypothetical protein